MLTDEVCGKIVYFIGTSGEIVTFTPHPPPSEAPSPQGEGFGKEETYESVLYERCGQ